MTRATLDFIIELSAFVILLSAGVCACLFAAAFAGVLP
jgi:hypothetical protein